MARAYGFGLLIAAAGLAGCDSSFDVAGPPPEEIIVRVFDDSEDPVAQAEIASGGFPIRTDATGVATVRLDGPDGTRFDLNVRCPAGYASPSRPLSVTLRRGSRPPEYHATCKRTDHTVLVAIRTPGATGVPIVHLGREVGRIDESGVALVSIDAKVGDTFTLTLDTSERRFQYLRPQNPEVTLSVKQSDEIYTFEQKFTEERPVVYRPPPPKPYVPKRLN